MKLPFFLARRFVAAETVEKTLPVARDLCANGLFVTLDYLGEDITDRNLAKEACDSYIRLISEIARSDKDVPTSPEPDPTSFSDVAIDRNISIKLSMLGQRIDKDFCEDNLHRLLESARDKDAFVRLDMEGSDVTASTLDLFERVVTEYPDNVGIVLQAYLKRTEDDIERMCELGARVRLCKGAYKEPASIAYQDMNDIRDRYIAYMQRLITGARYPGIATHDDILIDATREFVRSESISLERFEFQMLYGIRPESQLDISREGFNMRVYIPFGGMWLPYFSRRLRERKENVFFVLRNLVRR